MLGHVLGLVVPACLLSIHCCQLCAGQLSICYLPSSPWQPWEEGDGTQGEAASRGRWVALGPPAGGRLSQGEAHVLPLAMGQSCCCCLMVSVIKQHPRRRGAPAKARPCVRPWRRSGEAGQQGPEKAALCWRHRMQAVCRGGAVSSPG